MGDSSDKAEDKPPSKDVNGADVSDSEDEEDAPGLQSAYSVTDLLGELDDNDDEVYEDASDGGKETGKAGETEIKSDNGIGQVGPPEEGSKENGKDTVSGDVNDDKASSSDNGVAHAHTESESTSSCPVVDKPNGDLNVAATTESDDSVKDTCLVSAANADDARNDAAPALPDAPAPSSDIVCDPADSIPTVESEKAESNESDNHESDNQTTANSDDIATSPDDASTNLPTMNCDEIYTNADALLRRKQAALLSNGRDSSASGDAEGTQETVCADIAGRFAVNLDAGASEGSDSLDRQIVYEEGNKAPPLYSEVLDVVHPYSNVELENASKSNVLCWLKLERTVVPVMNGHLRDQAKVSVHCRWPLVTGTDGQAGDAKYNTPCNTT